MARVALVSALVAFGLLPAPLDAQLGRGSGGGGSDGEPIVVRTGMLAAHIRELAGYEVRVPSARVVGLLNPRAFVVDTSMSLPPIPGNRHRVLVLVERGELSVAPETIVASTVVVTGVARTVLGMQVSREVPWPAQLDAKAIERLEIHAAILARSVQTAEGVELAVSPP